jgi:hypothetical protein
MKIICAALLAAVLGSTLVGAQGWDKKTIEKMLSDGAKKMNSANPSERDEGMGYILGYITCAYKKQYLPVIVKGLKDTNPKVRIGASQTLARIEGKEAITDPVALLNDPEKDVRERVAFDLGAIGDPSAIPAMEKARDTWRTQNQRMTADDIQEGIDEITGKSKTEHPKCP